MKDINKRISKTLGITSFFFNARLDVILLFLDKEATDEKLTRCNNIDTDNVLLLLISNCKFDKNNGGSDCVIMSFESCVNEQRHSSTISSLKHCRCFLQRSNKKRIASLKSYYCNSNGTWLIRTSHDCCWLFVKHLWSILSLFIHSTNSPNCHSIKLEDLHNSLLNFFFVGRFDGHPKDAREFWIFGIRRVALGGCSRILRVCRRFLFVWYRWSDD